MIEENRKVLSLGDTEKESENGCPRCPWHYSLVDFREGERMANFCGGCGAAMDAGSVFCRACGAARPGAGAPSASKGSSLPWVIAVLAVLLLGVASGYILMLKQADGASTATPVVDTPPTPATADGTAPVTAAPATVPPVPAAAVPTAAPAPVASVPPVAATISSGGNGGGDRLIGSYTAYIGREDLYASDGVRLTQPWQILRQDRANVHRFGIRHPGDSGDSFFAIANNRATMERMLMQGRISPAAARAIVAGGSMVEVSIYGSGTTGRYLDIQVN
jgi:hypothetical protein